MGLCLNPRVIKEDLVDRVSERANVTKREAAEYVEAAVAALTNILVAGKKVEIRDFGTFRPILRKAKLGRIISTGETVQVPPRMAPKFVPGKTLKALVNRGATSS